MTPKRTTAASDAGARFVIVTLDAHLASAVARARGLLARQLPGLELAVHVAAEWGNDPAAAERCRQDLAAADFIVVTQMFVDEQIAEILPTLQARRDACDALIGVMSAPEVMRLTRMGGFEMSGEGGAGAWSPATLLRRMLGGRRDAAPAAGSGEKQVRAMRRVPQLLRFIPGAAQDVRAYYQVMQYWTAGTDENVTGLVRHVVSRYARGPRAPLARAAGPVPEPVSYPEVGVYHPSLPKLGMADDLGALPRAGSAGTVGLLLMRSYLLARNTAHYDAVIRALEARGLRVIAAFAFGLDGRPAIDRYFRDAGGATRIDALVSLTGFSLVGGPAYNDASAAQAALASLDVPYLSMQTLEFQSVGEWQEDVRGLNPLQAALQVAIPELDGATGPLVFGGRCDGAAGTDAGASAPVAERVERL
ncbi:MAG: Protoporphyrin IX Mg-chelatase subunit H, partial [uncultured Gemmatimonadaceae bacterium]